ncbi:mitochondrion biogenesis protein Mmm1, putative [Talaromyces stipitatus ATCC 10500]|uniref:Maintenance of mitochondrial morphology protein 1 n=1 Tax=Talaromyces stipitatus (strain ATCC 10500 / CBS 375.48 / QM 6759 / NRRL 1006) TaxID=441959 RepID=MMM1_TALSN|nr:mitochondrion biogenesis protein Mmm1, putative [Talaromyces stipitatus ATCC 10500]B8MTT8.1 RecName: Full=Maintenance of mitochondrial morphology protein 1 [Talaromyces stipitatus ATCC 10500]EED12481.1 mitochondrion biogenesis protein Mmm1, putative [Talaromyces stipitatus ATCC 10500]
MSQHSQYGVPGVPAQSSLSFTQGFLLGQLSVVLLIGAFIKFFIFGEAPAPPSRGLASRTASHHRSYSINQGDNNANNNTNNGSSPRTLREKPSTSNVLRPVPSSATNTRSILRKTYYNAIPTQLSHTKQGRHRIQHSTHQPESLDWFNVLIAQTIAQYRQTAYLLKDSPTSSILDSLSAAINDPQKKPSFIDTIKVTDISLGEEFPIFSNCRVIAVDDSNSDGGRLQALMDVDLSDDNLSLAIETSLILNYPKPRSAVLPVALSVSVVRFSGTLCISLIPASTPQSPSSAPTPDAGNLNMRSLFQHISAELNGTAPNPTATNPSGKKGVPKTNLAFSFLPDYRLDLSVRSLIGSRSRLQDVPKVAQLVEARIQSWFEERVVEPRVQVVGLPDFWPRMGRTGVRPGDDVEAAAAAAAASVSSRSGGGPVEATTLSGSAEEAIIDDSPVRPGLRFRGSATATAGRSDSSFEEIPRASPQTPLDIPGSMPRVVRTP